METELHTPTIGDAEELTALLVGAFPAIEAVLLFGSVARRDANPWSDIDLVVTSSDPKLTVAELRKVISERDHVSLIYYRTPSFETLHLITPFPIGFAAVSSDSVGLKPRQDSSLRSE
jgi:predicted nucleotidyltransferase